MITNKEEMLIVLTDCTICGNTVVNPCKSVQECPYLNTIDFNHTYNDELFVEADGE